MRFRDEDRLLSSLLPPVGSQDGVVVLAILFVEGGHHYSLLSLFLADPGNAHAVFLLHPVGFRHQHGPLALFRLPVGVDDCSLPGLFANVGNKDGFLTLLFTPVGNQHRFTDLLLVRFGNAAVDVPLDLTILGSVFRAVTSDRLLRPRNRRRRTGPERGGIIVTCEEQHPESDSDEAAHHLGSDEVKVPGPDKATTFAKSSSWAGAGARPQAIPRRLRCIAKIRWPGRNVSKKSAAAKRNAAAGPKRGPRNLASFLHQPEARARDYDVARFPFWCFFKNSRSLADS